MSLFCLFVFKKVYPLIYVAEVRCFYTTRGRRLCSMMIWRLYRPWLCIVADLFYFLFFRDSTKKQNYYFLFQLRSHLFQHLRVSLHPLLSPSFKQQHLLYTDTSPYSTSLYIVSHSPPHSITKCSTVSSTAPHKTHLQPQQKSCSSIWALEY